MARVCKKCGQPMEDHDGKPPHRVCPLKLLNERALKFGIETVPRYGFDPGRTQRKQRQAERDQEERIELEARRMARAEAMLEEMD